MARAAIDGEAGKGSWQRRASGSSLGNDGIALGQRGIHVAFGAGIEELREARFEEEPFPDGDFRRIEARRWKALDHGPGDLEPRRRGVALEGRGVGGDCRHASGDESGDPPDRLHSAILTQIAKGWKSVWNRHQT